MSSNRESYHGFTNEVLVDSETAKSMMQTHHLGTLDETSKLILKSNERQVKLSDTFSPTFLSPRSWKSATLHAKQAISWDTRIFTFQLESEDQMLGLPKGQHLVMRVWDPVNEEAVIRPYTPLPTAPKKGYVDILIKLYFATQDAIGGRMSLVLDRIPIGNAIELKGPIGKFEYLGNGSCSIKNVRRKIKRFGMICAGSGITPIYQILHAVVNDPEDFTRCIMLNGNRTIEDILCKEGIDLLITKSDGRAKVVYTLTQATNTWSGLRGRIDQDLIREYCEKDDSTLILVCGPKDFENSVRIALEDQGWSKEQVVFF